MTLRKSILGIFLFAVQVSIAIYYNPSVDLKLVVAIFIPTLAFIIYKFVTRKYDSL